jgi:hemoglobin
VTAVPPPRPEPETTLYDEVGGEAFFAALVDRFYQQVALDPVLRPLYPAGELGESRRALTGFLVQYWGGPAAYSDERGHPRLRMRHAPFVIGPAQRDAWLGHMAASVRFSGADVGIQERLVAYFEMAATHMVNTPG